ncbi:MAG: tetratricopeptide repeat protein [Bacteroidales bacterium]|nr:tetratricopeptide repeat protein [Candidatus Cacconaster scatequi]
MKLRPYIFIKPAVSLFLMMSCALLSAQERDPQLSSRMESARKLYYNGSYYAAEKAFGELSRSLQENQSLDKYEVDAFLALCAIATDKPNMEGLVSNYCSNYPAAPQQDKVKFALASKYFDKGEYKSALEVFRTINPTHIDKSQKTDFEFRNAYCELRDGNRDVAQRTFEKIRGSRYSKFSIPSTYYLGYSYYLTKDFEKAASLFDECFNDQRFSLLARYYAVESRFMMKNYQYVRTHGPELMNDLDRDLQINMARIISEACFADGDNTEARKYLDIYKSSGKELSRKDYYYSGILASNLNSYDDAIASFNKVLGTDDELSQSAHYHMANCYLKMKNKVTAMEQFKLAGEKDFDPVIKEDACFNYAKLTFDINSDISQFTEYLGKYPDQGKEDIINGYMADSFLLSKDYRSAVDILLKIKRPTASDLSNLQKASFFRAVQLIENGGYRSAIPMLEISIEKGAGNPNLQNLAKFWLAECYYRNEQYAKAIDLNRGILTSNEFSQSGEYASALLNQGYCYLKTGEYGEAQKLFSDYVNGPYKRKTMLRDAKCRLADVCFMQKNYEEASALYEDLYSSDPVSGDVYPGYQAAVAYGLMGDLSRKITLLNQIVRSNPTAKLYPQSLYELGRSYVQTGKDSRANECFYTLLACNDSSYYEKTLLELAMLSSNNRKYDAAIEYYKTIVAERPHAKEAQDAISGLESVYQTLNRPEDFLAYIDMMGLSHLKSEGEKESMIFRSVEQKFLSGNYSVALTSLKKYLSSYPNGADRDKALYYCGECQRNLGRPEAAADYYFKVMNSDDSGVWEIATVNYAKIKTGLQQYSQAARAYDKLIEKSSKEEVRNEALLGRTKALYETKHYASAVKDAQKLTASSGLSKEMRREANFLMAKSYRMMGEADFARAIFTDLAMDCSDQYGGESSYILILEAYDKGDFPDVELKVYAFADKGSKQLYWLAKSFIVLGDSFADRNDYTQARATFESILQEYSPRENDDVLDQVNSRIELLNKMNM